MKYKVSDVLVQYIKNIREKNGITATAIAKGLDKSKAYVTKFDNLEQKEIDSSDLKKIFLVLAENDAVLAEEYEDGYFSMLADTYRDNVSLYIDSLNYSHMEKMEDIPNDLVKRINRICSSYNLSMHEIVDVANQNLPVRDYATFKTIPFNEYYPIPATNLSSEDDDKCAYFKIKISDEEVSSILDFSVTEQHYYILRSFINAMHILLIKSSIEKFPDIVTDDDLYERANLYTSNLMYDYKYYSVCDAWIIKQDEENAEKLKNTLSSLPNSINQTLSNLINITGKIYKQNQFYVEMKLEHMDKNLTSDPAMFFAALQLPFYKVKKLNSETKNELLKEIDDVITKYAETANDGDQFELI